MASKPKTRTLLSTQKSYTWIDSPGSVSVSTGSIDSAPTSKIPDLAESSVSKHSNSWYLPHNLLLYQERDPDPDLIRFLKKGCGCKRAAQGKPCSTLFGQALYEDCRQQYVTHQGWGWLSAAHGTHVKWQRLDPSLPRLQLLDSDRPCYSIMMDEGYLAKHSRSCIELVR